MKRAPFRGLGAILFKEFIVVWRDPMTLFFMFFPPLVEMIAFGYALDTDVKHMALVILNEDRTVESRQFIDRFVNTETFRVVGEVQTIESLLHVTGRHNVPIDIRPQMLYNPAMKSPNFYIPGVIGIVLQIGTTFATAMAVVREREKGTLETLLVSPLSRWGLMLGKLVPYLCIGMTMATI